MVSKTLILLFILGILVAAVQAWLRPDPPPKPHKIEVGKTLALVRMRRLGVEDGDWRQYTTARLYLV